MNVPTYTLMPTAAVETTYSGTNPLSRAAAPREPDVYDDLGRACVALAYALRDLAEALR